ncbi:hypothetical protein BHM03_00053568 [Ensete ventricosum]|nr:hypothetical protein BHM03_00053568 [Ensete ventricosum]
MEEAISSPCRLFPSLMSSSVSRGSRRRVCQRDRLKSPLKQSGVAPTPKGRSATSTLHISRARSTVRIPITIIRGISDRIRSMTDPIPSTSLTKHKMKITKQS